MSDKTDSQNTSEAELDDSQLEAAAGGSVPVLPIFKDRNGNGIPDIFEPSPTFPDFE